MAALYMITLESKLLPADIASTPSAAAIATALKDIPAQIAKDVPTTKWYGPGPRITRVQGDGGVITTIQYALEQGDSGPISDTFANAIAGAARSAISDAQRKLGSVSATAVDFDAAKFGDAAGWASGQAQRTITADAPAQPGQTQDDPALAGATIASQTPTNWKNLAIAGGVAAALVAAIYYGSKDSSSRRSMSRR